MVRTLELKSGGSRWIDGTSGMIFISACCDYCLTFSSLLWAIRLVQLHS